MIWYMHLLSCILGTLLLSGWSMGEEVRRSLASTAAMEGMSHANGEMSMTSKDVRDSGKRKRRGGKSKVKPKAKPRIRVKSIQEARDLLNYTFPTTQMLRNYGEKTLPRIRFIHLPKTGTTFAATVVHYGCSNVDDIYIDVLLKLNTKDLMPWKVDKSCKERILNGQKKASSKNGNWWPHKPYFGTDDKGFAVTLLREPTSRLASQLYHMYSLYGRSIAFGIDDADVIPIIGILKGRKLTKELADTFPVPIVDESSPTGYKNGVSNFAPQMEKFKQAWFDCDKQSDNRDSGRCKWKAAALYPGLTGCMTKMIIGRGCCDKYDITDEDVEEAKRRIRQDFAFIGLQERWNTSVELFHFKYGGKLFHEELSVRRKAPKELQRHEMEKAVKAGVEDPADTELYKYAKELFEGTLLQYTTTQYVWSFSTPQDWTRRRNR